MRRFTIRTLFVVIALVACILGFAVRFHARSMIQYHELCKLDNERLYVDSIDDLFASTANQDMQKTSGLMCVFLEDEIYIDSHTGLITAKALNVNEPRGGWLCECFDYRYVLSAPYVWVTEPSLAAEQQVARLKNVEQILIIGSLTDSVRTRWETRFPNAKILDKNEVSSTVVEYGK